MNMPCIHLAGLVVLKVLKRTLSKLYIGLSINRLMEWKKWSHKESQRTGERKGRSKKGGERKKLKRT